MYRLEFKRCGSPFRGCLFLLNFTILPCGVFYIFVNLKSSSKLEWNGQDGKRVGIFFEIYIQPIPCGF